ncbi:MAG: dienelactone hydrolase family protein, partial [Chloroflexota bacterium]|nr:dienelactone hydrolase family protein [Chloroflexota bacterium]
MGDTVRIQAAAGDTDAYFAPARITPDAPVLLLHPWWGLNQAIRDQADRLAGDGFTVMAPDLFDGTVLTTADDAEAFLASIG